LRELRTMVDWEIAPRLGRVPGVVEVNSWGGDKRQIVVQPDMKKLLAHRVTQGQLVEALSRSGVSTSAGMIEHGEEGTFIRVDGTYRSPSQVADQLVEIAQTELGTHPVVVADVATVTEGAAPRFSAATADGKGETIYTMVQMLAGA